MNIIYLNKYETNYPWGAEVFINTGFSELDIDVFNIDYVKHAFRISSELKKLDLTLFDGSLVQRGVGYNMPRSVISLLPRPRILVITELVRRIMVQSYMWDQDLFDFFYVRTPTCIKTLEESFQIPREKTDIFLSGFDPTLFYPIESGKEIDVLFAGTITERRKQVIDELASALGDKLFIRKAFGKELNVLINQAKIIVNIHGSDEPDTETRVYETLGTKGFLITETLSEESPFIDGDDLIECDSIPEMIEKIKYYLAEGQKNERDLVSSVGYEKVVENHTYSARSAELINKLKGFNGYKNHQITRMSFYRAYTEERWKSFKAFLLGPVIGLYHKLRTA